MDSTSASNIYCFRKIPVSLKTDIKQSHDVCDLSYPECHLAAPFILHLLLLLPCFLTSDAHSVLTQYPVTYTYLIAKTVLPQVFHVSFNSKPLLFLFCFHFSLFIPYRFRRHFVICWHTSVVLCPHLISPENLNCLRASYHVALFLYSL